jgi:hypothetical protein
MHKRFELVVVENTGLEESTRTGKQKEYASAHHSSTH